MKISKYIAMFLTAGFIAIVLMERIPGVLTPTDVPFEWLMFHLFKISLLDDITHGLSGILGICALLGGYRYWVKWLMLIGGYYSLDAIFFIINGIMTGQAFSENIQLNLPHVMIMIFVIIALRASVRKIELR
jgi:hypothetical protein